MHVCCKNLYIMEFKCKLKSKSPWKAFYLLLSPSLPRVPPLTISTVYAYRIYPCIYILLYGFSYINRNHTT